MAIKINRELPYVTSTYIDNVISGRNKNYNKHKYYQQYNLMLRRLDDFVKSMSEKGFKATPHSCKREKSMVK